MRSWLVLIVVLFAMPALAKEGGFTFGEPGFGGPGCPGEGTPPSVVATEQAVEITFSDYAASAGGWSFGPSERLSCNVSIPFSAPPGRALGIVQVDYSGLARLGPAGNAELNIEAFFTGGRGEEISETFSSPMSGDVSATQAVSPTWSACGASGLLRVSSSLRVTTSHNSTALISLSAANGGPGVTLHLEWRQC
jgi:hypothetical protein